ncbi:MAG TPA: hypothetical protein VE593_11315 [Nitrososphaeraceae archaeon]|nr:hypothetical protein [Nitrososphaeraceae archaeon]
MSFTEGPDRRKRLLKSMIILAVVVMSAGLGTNFLLGYLRAQDPIYQCIKDPNSQPFQLSIPITVTRDGSNVAVPPGIGMSNNNNCTRPVYTIKPDIIHVSYGRPFPFTLGHFLYNWKVDLTKYNTKVYVNNVLHTDGSFLDIVLKQGMSIRIDFASKSK